MCVFSNMYKISFDSGLGFQSWKIRYFSLRKHNLVASCQLSSELLLSVVTGPWNIRGPSAPGTLREVSSIRELHKGWESDWGGPGPKELDPGLGSISRDPKGPPNPCTLTCSHWHTHIYTHSHTHHVPHTQWRTICPHTPTYQAYTHTHTHSPTRAQALLIYEDQPLWGCPPLSMPWCQWSLQLPSGSHSLCELKDFRIPKVKITSPLGKAPCARSRPQFLVWVTAKWESWMSRVGPLRDRNIKLLNHVRLWRKLSTWQKSEWWVF